MLGAKQRENIVLSTERTRSPNGERVVKVNMFLAVPSFFFLRFVCTTRSLCIGPSDSCFRISELSSQGGLWSFNSIKQEANAVVTNKPLSKQLALLRERARGKKNRWMDIKRDLSSLLSGVLSVAFQCIAEKLWVNILGLWRARSWMVKCLALLIRAQVSKDLHFQRGPWGQSITKQALPRSFCCHCCDMIVQTVFKRAHPPGMLRSSKPGHIL